MARNPRKKTQTPTKKHLARIERERRQTRYIIIGSIIVLVLVVGVILYGILDQQVLRGMRTVAVVNGERISANEFRSYTKYFRYTLIRNAENTYQLASLFGSDQNTLQSFVSQIQGIAAQMETFQAGETALNDMVDNLLIRQESAKRGITVSEEEVEKGVQEAMRYFPDGTSTPTQTQEALPTSTLSPLQLTLIPPTATIAPSATPTATLQVTSTVALAVTPTLTSTFTPIPTPTQVLTPTATATTAPTATPYTFEAYQNEYATVVADFKDNFLIPEETIRYAIEADIYRKKLAKEVIGEVPCLQEEVWAFHILVDDEQTAQDIRKRLDQGEDWGQLASTYSTDTSNKDKGGDLGWFPKGQMVAEFEDAAFGLEVGETSQPVQTQFGWHIIRVLGHEDRPMTASECNQLPAIKFQEWLDEFRGSAQVEIRDFWQEIVPILPTMPPEITQLLQEAGVAPNPTPGAP